MRHGGTRRWVLVVFCGVALSAGLAACSPQPSIRGVPPEPPLSVRRGDEAFALQDYDRAINNYGVYLERVHTGPYTAVAAYKSALAAYRLRRYEQTLYLLDDLGSRYPDGKWMQVDALRGDAERALGRNMLAIRAWADAWDLAGAEDQQKLARRIQSVARTMDAGQLEQARSLVDNDDIRDLLYPGATGVPTIAVALHEPEEEEDVAGAQPRSIHAAAPAPTPRRAVAPPPPPVEVEPEEDLSGAWAPPALEDLPTTRPSAVPAAPHASTPAARRPPPEPALAVESDRAPTVEPEPVVVEPEPVPPAAAPPAATEAAEVASLPAFAADTEIEESEARVGVLLPVTGQYGGAGTAAWQAVQLAFKNLRWRLLLADTGYGGERSALDDLWGNANVVAVIGPFVTAGGADTTSPVDGLPPLVLPDQAGAGPVRLPLGGREVDLLDPLLRYATGPVKLDRFAILYPETPAGRAARAAFQHAVQGRGRTIVGAIGYPAGTAALAAYTTPLLDWRRQDHLQAVFLADDVAMAGRLAAFLHREMPDVTLLGAEPWSALVDDGAAVRGVLFADAFFAGSTRPATRDFVDAYKADYGSTPGSLEAQAYDLATLAERALAMGVDSRAAMRERLREVGAVEGATGLVQATPDGLSRPGVVLRVYDGKLTEVAVPG